ncbi:MAG TPA: DUF4199 domain-containing protein [Polyangia bacterium]|jgi:hypothetical protein
MKTWMKYGIGFGLATAAWTLVEYALGFHTTRIADGQLTSYLALVLPVTFVVLAGLAERRRLPTASVGRYLAVALLVMLVGDAITTPFLWAYHHYVLPDWLDRLMAFEREKLLLAGAPANVVDLRLAAIARGNSTAAQIVGGLLGSTVLGLILGVPLGFILRRRPGSGPTASGSIAQRAIG